MDRFTGGWAPSRGVDADRFLRRGHRVVAATFLLTIPPAAYFSTAGATDPPSVFVYLPLIPLFGLIISGTYLLVRPWVQKARARRVGSAPARTDAKP